MGSIRVPYSRYFVSLNPENPKLEIDLSITNFGFQDLTDLQINISESVVFYEKYTDIEKKLKIFEKQIAYEALASGVELETVIIGEQGDFDLVVLTQFAESFNYSMGYQSLFNVEVSGACYSGLIPFKIEYRDYCMTCV